MYMCMHLGDLPQGLSTVLSEIGSLMGLEFAKSARLAGQ